MIGAMVWAALSAFEGAHEDVRAAIKVRLGLCPFPGCTARDCWLHRPLTPAEMDIYRSAVREDCTP